MAGNTIMTAKNSFSEGLIMDFAPDNTNANSLTSALNATLLTFNGNEMSLLNDMGNGRVETAYLPDGYIPVGTCEFGDIIYVVSYNPLIDKALIGCFPSPERNISSEELQNVGVILNKEEFQEFSNNKPTGNLKTTSVRKILFNNDLHPGDKYIIYSENIDNNKNYISNYGNKDKNFDGLPKFLNIRIVSIEDSGKITYLDSSVKWYDNDYYIQNSNKQDNKPDIDSYRSLVSSAYNIYSSKISGKLALLIELEKISGFSHSWEVYYNERNLYDVYFNLSWNSNSKLINPKYIQIKSNEIDYLEIDRNYILEESCYTHEFDQNSIESIKLVYENYVPKVGHYNTNNTEITLKDDIVVLYYNYPITKKLNTSFNSEDVFNYTITPCMPYGILEEFSLKGVIDFKKIGKENIKLNTWKYYSNEESCTLTWGMEAYTNPGRIVSKVEFEFYDDLGCIAKYDLSGKNSYNGVFTEHITYNSYGSNYKQIKPDIKVDDVRNQSLGIIHSNTLYLVKINVFQSFILPDGTKTELKEITHSEFRWFWTNGVFNKYYHLVLDYDKLNLVLDLDCLVSFTPKDNFKTILEKDEIIIENLNLEELSQNVYNNIQCIGLDNKANLSMTVVPALQNNFNTFFIHPKSKFNLLTKIDSSSVLIENYPENPELSYIDNTGVQYDLNQKFDESNTFMELSILNSNNIEFNEIVTIDLNFKARHYSKYGVLAESKLNLSKTLRPIILRISDLNKYGLMLDNNVIKLNKIYFESIDNEWDTEDEVVYNYTISEIKHSYNTLSEIKSGYKTYKNGNQNYKTLNKIPKVHIKEYLPLIFPYSIGYNQKQLSLYIKDDNDKEGNWEKYRNNPTVLGVYIENVNREDGTTFDVIPGTLAIRNLVGEILVMDDWNTNIQTFSKNIISLLTSIYYLSDEIIETSVKLIKHLIYLKDNYTQYSGKILTAVSEKENEKYDIRFNGEITLSEYVDKIKTNVNNTEITNNNVTILFNSCEKITPVLFKLNYVAPENKYYGDSTRILSSIKINNSYTNNTYQSFSPNLLYVIDLNDNFVSFKSSDTVKILKDYTINNDGTEYLRFRDAKSENKKLNNILKNLLNIQNEELYISSLFETFTGQTYEITTCYVGDKNKTQISLIGYPNNYNIL